MYVKFVSDLDYSFNPENGKYDVPAVEWETPYGTFWERFESEEARSQALADNEAYNESPEVKAYIQEMDEAEDKWSAETYTAELFEYALENSQTVALRDAIQFSECFKPKVQAHIANLVCKHNKLMLKAKRVPAPAMNTIADFM
jgi:hypothetical protein